MRSNKTPLALFNMNSKLLLVLVSCALSIEGHVSKHHFVLRSSGDAESSVDDDWWKAAIIYQIYPRSFMDSDGDGIGDLKGIISKLDHLQDMGVTATWLSPIYKSPGVDQGYDISDYKAIDPDFGTLDDLKELVATAHGMGIKIIMDFVPNHTSDQHEWFQKSVANDSIYKDYYIWKDGPTDSKPPNNWVSVFGGSAWQYNDDRKQYYLHQFASAQPDLNYRNKAVVGDMKAILNYWLDFGVDGFRMDAVPFLFEDSDFKDEPLTGAADVNSNQYGYLKHIYTNNLDETYDMIFQFREVLDDFNGDSNKNISYTRIMMTEAYADTSEQTVAYYGNSTRNGAHFTFNFNLIQDLNKNFTADNLINTISKWFSHLSKNYVSNWVLGNHDKNRVATRLGVENVDALNMLTAFLPGVQVTYMGEEIGMEDGEVACNEGHDPQAKNCSTFNETSRDFERTPFHWDNTSNAGFTTSDKPCWLPVSKKYKTNNLKAQNVEGVRSHYNVYKSLVKFRQNFKNITDDAVSLIKLASNVVQIVRTTDQSEFVYLFNPSDKNETVTVFTNGVSLKVLVTDINSQFSEGDILPQKVTLNSHESLILEAGEVAESSAVNIPFSSVWFSLLFVVFVIKMY